MNIETVQFFEYNIRSTVIDDVRMYLVADLLNQYNKKNGRKKEFTKYLQNQQTRELLESKLVRPISALRNTTDIEKVSKHWNIEGVIKYVSLCITTHCTQANQTRSWLENRS